VRFTTYNRRSLTYYWRTNLSVALGAAVATAALTGALVVGDSMRASLAEAAVGRLGTIDHALRAPRMFRASLADEITHDPGVKEQIKKTAPVLLLRGSAKHADTNRRTNRISIIGVGADFWTLNRPSDPTPPVVKGRNVILNEALADELGAKVGDDILLQMGKPSAISTETLLGRRDDTTTTIRLTVKAILAPRGLAAFDLNPKQASPKNAFVPLAVLQRATDQRNRANAILVDDNTPKDSNSPALLDAALADNLRLADIGLKLRIDSKRGYVSLESESMLIDPAIESATLKATQGIGVHTSLILAHLANKIRKKNGDTIIPYSTAAAIDPQSATARTFRMVTGEMLTQSHDILLNAWAAEDLNAKPGDTIEMEYYVTGPDGRLDTTTASFTLRGILEHNPAATDPGFVPEYKGVTDTENLSDWDPPFPVDLSLVRDKDEKYWDDDRTTPKAFISLADGQDLWADQPKRFGSVTSIRVYPESDQPNANKTPARKNDIASSADTNRTLESLSAAFEKALLTEIDPKSMGLSFVPIRKTVLEASEGTTDFGGLFIGFSFFLIASAAMLVALLFRLSIEQRTTEIGLLLALGIQPRKVRRQLIIQGFWLSLVGAVFGTVAALAYAALMLSGLRTIWSDAVNTPFLRMTATPTSLTIGAFASILIAAGAAALSIRSITRQSARSLLAGKTEQPPFSTRGKPGRTGSLALTMGGCAILLVAVSLATDAIPPVAGFFASGFAALIAGLAAFTSYLKKAVPKTIRVKGFPAMLKLAARNAPRHFGRSVTTAGLIAFAAFLIVSLEAFRLHADDSENDIHSGTGGFELYAESATPLPYNLNSKKGRNALGIEDDLGDTTFISFRLRPGDESSCLNLYKPREPRIIAAPSDMIQRGGFRFASTMQFKGTDPANPWKLLNHHFDDGAIPAIGDEAAVLWQLHLGLGKDLTIKDQRGTDINLRFVGLLKGSALQDEIIIADDRFTELFPSISGHAFFLIDTQPSEISSVESKLEQNLTAFSFDVASLRKRLADYNAVQNTYLSTFQALGGLGLILGTAGLAAVLLRNIWERRRELAIMRAVGYPRRAIATVVLAENVTLIASGLGIGTGAALIAILPPIVKNAQSIPMASLLLVILASFGVGVLAGTVAVYRALSAPLVDALRTE